MRCAPFKKIHFFFHTEFWASVPAGAADRRRVDGRHVRWGWMLYVLVVPIMVCVFLGVVYINALIAGRWVVFRRIEMSLPMPLAAIAAWSYGSHQLAVGNACGLAALVGSGHGSVLGTLFSPFRKRTNLRFGEPDFAGNFGLVWTISLYHFCTKAWHRFWTKTWYRF